MNSECNDPDHDLLALALHSLRFLLASEPPKLRQNAAFAFAVLVVTSLSMCSALERALSR